MGGCLFFDSKLSGMFQKNSFQLTAFQTGPINNEAPSYVGDNRYTYVNPYQRYRSEEYHREQVRKEKSDLEKLNSVLEENKRKAVLAAESMRIALDKKNKARLKKLEQEYQDEIARLLMVRVELIRRVRQSEEMLICMMAMKRKRLRAINWQAINRLQ